MSGEDDYEERLKRFQERYPFENSLVFLISAKFNEIYNHVYSGSGFQGYGNKEIKFNVTKAQDGSNSISMSEEGMLFLGALSRAITENILSFLGSDMYEQDVREKAEEAAKQYVKQVNPFLLQNPKRCPKCGLDNDYNAKYCKECATKL